MSDLTDWQRRITRIALDTIGADGFAPAGSGAILEHGVTDRPTEDVDMGVDWRSHEPTRLEVGPVLSVPDAIAATVMEAAQQQLGHTSLDVTRLHVQRRDVVDVSLPLSAVQSS